MEIVPIADVDERSTVRLTLCPGHNVALYPQWTYLSKGECKCRLSERYHGWYTLWDKRIFYLFQQQALDSILIEYSPRQSTHQVRNSTPFDDYIIVYEETIASVKDDFLLYLMTEGL